MTKGAVVFQTEGTSSSLPRVCNSQPPPPIQKLAAASTLPWNLHVEVSALLADAGESLAANTRCQQLRLISPKLSEGRRFCNINTGCNPLSTSCFCWATWVSTLSQSHFWSSVFTGPLESVFAHVSQIWQCVLWSLRSCEITRQRFCSLYGHVHRMILKGTHQKSWKATEMWE